MATPAHDIYVEHSLWSSMFFPQSRLFLAGNPKAAGTSLRWWLLEIHGIDVAALTADSLWGESAPYQVVWDETIDLRYLWVRLSDDEREDALVASDVLTVIPVRNPVTRAFSAWSGKYLSGEPYYEDRLPGTFPRLPATIDSLAAIREAFARFVDALADHVVLHPDWQGIDVHFWPQHLLLSRTPAGPTLLLRQEDMDEGLAQMADHLRKHGIAPVPTRRMNETIVGYQSELMDEQTLTSIVRLYKQDFVKWGYEMSAPAVAGAPPSFDHLNDVRGRNRRFGVIHRAMRAAEQHIAGLESELADAFRREQEFVASSSWRVTRPLRWVSRQVGRRST